MFLFDNTFALPNKIANTKHKDEGREVANKNTIISFRISLKNADVLNQLSKELHMSKSSILNDLLYKHLQGSQHFKRIESVKESSKEVYKTIKISFTKKEYDLLKCIAQNTTTSSVPKFIKFHTLNMIYNSKILDNKEIEALALVRSELNKIGVNINQIARVFNTQSEANIVSNLLTTLEHLDSKLIRMSSEIKSLCHNSQGILQ